MTKLRVVLTAAAVSWDGQRRRVICDFFPRPNWAAPYTFTKTSSPSIVTG